MNERIYESDKQEDSYLRKTGGLSTDLYEDWNKPKEAEKWRAKLPKTEAVKE